jgi:hypothetical protein
MAQVIDATILYSIDLGLSGKELTNSLPDKQLQSEFSEFFAYPSQIFKIML